MSSNLQTITHLQSPLNYDPKKHTPNKCNYSFMHYYYLAYIFPLILIWLTQNYFLTNANTCVQHNLKINDKNRVDEKILTKIELLNRERYTILKFGLNLERGTWFGSCHQSRRWGIRFWSMSPKSWRESMI